MSANSARRAEILKLLFAFLPLMIVCITVTSKFLGLRYWWLGFATAHAMYAFLQETALRGLDILGSLSAERITTNLSFAGFRSVPKIFPFQLKLLALATIMASIFLATIRNDLERGFAEIGNILVPEKLVLKIEYPAWTETPPLEKILERTATNLHADTASLLEIRPRNLKVASWLVTIRITSESESSPKENIQQFSARIGRDGTTSWSQSVAHVFDLFSIDKSKAAKIEITAKDDAGLELHETISISPIGLPKVVLLRSLPPRADFDTDSRETLFFKLSARSKTPLSLIELEARTKSGYRFSRIAAEFAGSFEKSVDGLSTSLPLLGVPFAPKDTLYIRAVARTIIPGLFGVSPEIEIPVTSSTEVKQQILAKLEEASKELVNEKSDFLARKLRVLDLLRESEDLADSLGKRSPIKRQLSDAVTLAGRLESPKDPRVKQLHTKLQSLIDALHRSANMQETISLLARIQNLQIQSKKIPPNGLPRLSSEAIALSGETQRLKAKLTDLIREPALAMTNEEKNLAQHLLASDKTPELLRSAGTPLAAQNATEAEPILEQVVRESQTKLGGVLQLLSGARSRAIRAAQQSLNDADRRLQSARSKPPNNAQNEIRSGAESLAKVPHLSKELAESVGEAQEGTKEALEASRQNQPRKMQQELDRAQDAIARAIATLQDEEEMQNSMQQEMDSTEHRSNQELITAQGVLDASWRKRILEEISRLRAKGESADSPLLRFLESRLR